MRLGFVTLIVQFVWCPGVNTAVNMNGGSERFANKFPSRKKVTSWFPFVLPTRIINSKTNWFIFVGVMILELGEITTTVGESKEFWIVTFWNTLGRGILRIWE